MADRPVCVEGCFEVRFKDVCNEAVQYGHLECLRYAHEHGHPWDEWTCTFAADHGQLECLRYAHENGAEWGWWTMGWACAGGHLNCVRYAHENGCPWDGMPCTQAAKNGRLECLRYAHENGCPWDAGTCEWASRYGHLECLRYAHENGCPWNQNTLINASVGGSLECLRYAIEHGCPFPTAIEEPVHPPIVPELHHLGVKLLGDDNSDHLRAHIRRHVSSARTLLRCTVLLLRFYREACERVYSPDGGSGYREAEASFQETVSRTTR